MNRERVLHAVIFVSGFGWGFLVCLLRYAREYRGIEARVRRELMRSPEFDRRNRIETQGPALDKDRLVI